MHFDLMNSNLVQSLAKFGRKWNQLHHLTVLTVWLKSNTSFRVPPKNWCFWTVVLEKTLEGPLDCKEIQPVHSKGYQPWDFIGRNDAKAETAVLWPPDVKSWLNGKDSDAERDWGKEEKGTTEDEMAKVLKFQL